MNSISRKFDNIDSRRRTRSHSAAETQHEYGVTHKALLKIEASGVCGNLQGREEYLVTAAVAGAQRADAGCCRRPSYCLHVSAVRSNAGES